jgi:hypothetical protein
MMEAGGQGSWPGLERATKILHKRQVERRWALPLRMFQCGGQEPVVVIRGLASECTRGFRTTVQVDVINHSFVERVASNTWYTNWVCLICVLLTE